MEGRIVGQKSAKPLAERLVVLCQITTEPECKLQARLKATSGPDGTFAIKDVPPGRFTVAHAKSSEKTIAKLQDGAPIDPTMVPVRMLGGTTVDIVAYQRLVTTNMTAGNGLDIPSGNKLANVRGGVVNGTSGLTFEFRKGKLLMVEVSAGGVAKSEVSAWGQ